MFRPIIAFVLLGAATPAWAQAAADASTARAEGDRLIAAANAGEFFVNETTDAAIVLRHTTSGYRCVFNPGASANQIMVFPHERPGHNVGCSTQTITDSRTLYLTSATDAEATERLAFDAAVAGIRQRFPDAKPAKRAKGRAPVLVPPAGVDWPKPRVAVFTSSGGDQRVDVGKRGEWIVKYRYTAPHGVGAEGGPLDMFWTSTVLEGERRRASAPSQPAAAAVSHGRGEVRTVEEQSRIVRNVIDAANAEDVFEPVEQNGAVMYRHRLSGFTCGFQPGTGRLVISDQGVRGDEAGCRHTSLDMRESLLTMVKRMPRRVTLAKAMSDISRQIMAGEPGLKLSKEPAVRASFGAEKPGAPVIPAHETINLKGMYQGRQSYVRLSVALVGDWVVFQLGSTPLDGDHIQVDLVGELGFGALLMQMTQPETDQKV